jgi:outer membrane protein OmpA-like peptidoglycan-associated protein
MADITLAELNGRVWLVGGEGYLQDLLANTLGNDVSIELVQCERQSEVRELWVQNCGEPADGTDGMPWQIHPNIVARIRRRSPDYAVYFAQWSVLLDAEALAVINAAALWARENSEVPVTLAEYLDPSGPSAIADLSRLRAQLIEDKLAESGIARERIVRERRDVADVPGMAQESQRVDIIVRVG